MGHLTPSASTRVRTEFAAVTYLALDGAGSGSGAGATVEAKLTAGVDVGLGGSLKPFHFTLIENIDAPLYKQEWQLFDRTYAVTP